MATVRVALTTASDHTGSMWSSASASATTELVITASDSASAEARDLHDAVLTTMRLGGFQRNSLAIAATPTRRVLVWVTDTALSYPRVGPSPPIFDFVLPLLPNGASANLLPANFASAHARWYQPGGIDDLVPDVLVAGGLDVDGFRIFISYRHADCEAAAEQLFDSLSHRQFDVYLDRFRTQPGTDFLERIRYELADKACVLLLDSANVGQSQWVRGEYGFARKYRLGLMAVDLPGGRKTFPRIGTRIELARGSAALTKTSLLPQGEVDRAVVFVRNNYSVQLARRHRHQRRQITAAAGLSRTNCMPRHDGYFDVGPPPYVVGATARPPTLATLRPVCEAAVPAKGVLTGMKISPSVSAANDLDWMASRVNGVVVDERRLVRAMKKMQTGSL